MPIVAQSKPTRQSSKLVTGVFAFPTTVLGMVRNYSGVDVVDVRLCVPHPVWLGKQIADIANFPVEVIDFPSIGCRLSAACLAGCVFRVDIHLYPLLLLFS